MDQLKKYGDKTKKVNEKDTKNNDDCDDNNDNYDGEEEEDDDDDGEEEEKDDDNDGEEEDDDDNDDEEEEDDGNDGEEEEDDDDNDGKEAPREVDNELLALVQTQGAWLQQFNYKLELSNEITTQLEQASDDVERRRYSIGYIIMNYYNEEKKETEKKTSKTEDEKRVRDNVIRDTCRVGVEKNNPNKQRTQTSFKNKKQQYFVNNKKDYMCGKFAEDWDHIWTCEANVLTIKEAIKKSLVEFEEKLYEEEKINNFQKINFIFIKILYERSEILIGKEKYWELIRGVFNNRFNKISKDREIQVIIDDLWYYFIFDRLKEEFWIKRCNEVVELEKELNISRSDKRIRKLKDREFLEENKTEKSTKKIKIEKKLKK
ncbi:hypothetical protein C1646_775738 [Rhizophagus diaphanus]|nr:hypothetical protein C1646_775738 [Rhizophagus diaphanus] [Rhizophagus sp. MUCL 43196]